MKRAMVAATLALTGVLLAGCGGGGDDQARVETGLQNYLGNLYPEDSDFPTGAGPPRVKAKGCFKLEPPSLKRRVKGPARARVFVPKGVTFWRCAVIFGTYRPMRVAVVYDGTKVTGATPAPVGSGRVHQAPARTYTG
jgi:hypothetical protein